MNGYAHIVRAVFDKPWAVTPETLEVIASLVRQRASGVSLTEDEIRARLEVAAAAAGPRGGGRAMGPVGMVPIYGVIMQRASMMSEMSGGTSVQGITRAFRQAVADPEIGSILLDIDSPGGEVGGIDELAAEIRAAAGKPIAAIANSLMGSAAYYLASAAGEIIASPSSMVGSIGVRTAHVDASAAYEMVGLNPTIISSGKYKTELSDTGPLTEEGLAYLQEVCDDYYGQFVNAVAAGRGVTAAAVRNGFGEGRMLTAKRAVSAGLADRIGTFDDAVRRLSTGKVAPRGTQAIAAQGVGEPMHGMEVQADGEMATITAPDRTNYAAAAWEIARARLRAGGVATKGSWYVNPDVGAEIAKLRREG